MSSILLKIVTGAMHLKNNRREAKNMMEEVEKDLHGLGIVKPVHRFEKYFFEIKTTVSRKEPHSSKGTSRNLIRVKFMVLEPQCRIFG